MKLVDALNSETSSKAMKGAKKTGSGLVPQVKQETPAVTTDNSLLKTRLGNCLPVAYSLASIIYRER